MYDVPANELIDKLAEELKKIKEIKAPSWTVFVKTGMSKERPPVREDWWYVRAAAVLRTVRRLGPVGVAKLRTKYGGKKNRGHMTEHSYNGSGNIIRKVLQQLDAAGLTKKVGDGVKKGRIITPKGISLIDKVAVQMYKAKPTTKKDTAPKQAE
jgi:small subunit ribosomal protein S19e